MLFLFAGEWVKVELVEPAVVDKILHIEIVGVIEPYFSSCGKAIERVILVVLIAVPVSADELPIELLVLKLLSYVASEPPKSPLPEVLPKAAHRCYNENANITCLTIDSTCRTCSLSSLSHSTF